MSLTLKFPLAVTLYQILQKADLGGVRVMQRGRCLRHLKAEIESFEAERKKLMLDSHVQKDAEGKPLVTAEGNYVFKDMPAWIKAVMSLVDSDPLVIDIQTDADKGWVKLCKEVLNSDMCPKVSGEDGANALDIYDALCAVDVEPKKD